MHRGYADLHVHTHRSDGLHSPAEVVEMAVRANLSWLAITDHDTIDGLPEAQAAATRLGIGLVPGLELSVGYLGQDFHVLGYWIDPADQRLKELLAEVSAARVARARAIVRKLYALGVNLSYEEVLEQAKSPRAVGRPHVALALVKGGRVGSFAEAFARYLGSEAPAYVGKAPVDPARALGVIRRAGGVPVLAHPGAYHLNGALRVFIKEGLQGLETEYPRRGPEEAASFRRIADRHGLAITGGSDFHGVGISDVPLGGVRVDARLLDHLAARKEPSHDRN